MAKLKVTVDRQLCISSGECIQVAPDVFALDDENKAYVKTLEGRDEDVIFEAAEACPTNAIIIVDEESGRQLYPD